MAESDVPLPNGDPQINGSVSTVLHSVDQICLHVTDFQRHINLQLLVPCLVERRMITREERHKLMQEAVSSETRTLSLITEILPGKDDNILQQFKMALEDTLENDGSQGHQTLLKRFFGMSPSLSSDSDSDSDEVQQPIANTISDESEEFSIFMMNFTRTLESGNDKDVARRLKDVVNYLWPLKSKDNSYLVKRSARAELFSNDLTFSILFDCLVTSNPPVISYNDVSMLHKIIDKVLKLREACKKIIEPLQKLLVDYEKESGIAFAAADPEILAGSARIKAKVTNATNPDPKLKNGVKRSLLRCFRMNFRGSGTGSVVFYWDFPEEYIQQVRESCDNVCRNNTKLDQLRITKVEVQLDQKPYQISLEMEITDTVLLRTARKQRVIADDIAPEQEWFVLFLMKVDHLVGTYAEAFLSTPRKEISRPYAQFERNSFREMTDILISQDRLHCYDISYIQQFLLSLLKWDTSQGSENKGLLISLLKEAQDYEPVPTGSPLPLMQLQNTSRSASIVTHFFGVYFVSYEVMMTLKYALLQLLYLLPSSFQYVGWIQVNQGCQITWKTSHESLEKIEDKLRYHPCTAVLVTEDDFEVQYPYKITFSCKITNAQILLDGSPLLYPDLEDCSLSVQADMLCRVGHVCATCFMEYNGAFRLLWLHCFKSYEHQFVGKVNAVYDMSKLGLCRVRKLLADVAEQCSVKNCANGRKCTKAHSVIELKYWNTQQGRRRGPMNYSTAVSKGSTVKHFSMVKNRHFIQKHPSFRAIKGKLLPSNYQEKFHHLLYWEELQHIEELNQRCPDPVDVIICNDVTVAQCLKMNNTEYAMVGYVVMKDADSAKYVMQASQTVRLVLTDKVFIEADVVPLSFKHRIEYFSKLNMEYVPIALNSTAAASLKVYCIEYHRDFSKPISKIQVKYFIKHSYFKDLHQAVDNIPQLMIQRLFPSVSAAKRNFWRQDDNDLFINSLAEKLQAPFKPDKLQLEAISSMLSVSADVPFLLVGPFGTGKTHVLACAAAAIVKEDASAKVLIATHHNKSADTFVSKYFGTIDSTKTLPPTVAPIRIAAKDLSDDVEKPYHVRFNDPIITKELLDERRIVVTTFLTALHFASTEKVPRGYFTHILIDEGAQSREPETIAPLIFADDRTKVIIAGDHLQVGPKTVVLGENAIKYGLADSLIERLYNHYDNNNQRCPWIFNLLINYRSHEAIMRLSSNLFYNSTVVSKSSSRLHPHTYYPLHFVCTSLEDGTFQDVSDIHCDEADVVLREVKKYTESWPKQWEKRAKSSVCVVSSSRNQVIQLQTKLSKLQINHHSYIEVLPSFDLQGREFRAIFVSTTEATDVNGCSKNPTKSMTDPFVFNTVITRAQSLVVCVGNPYFLCHLAEKTKPGNKCWSMYIKCCLDYETFSMTNSTFGQMEKERLQSELYLNSSTRSQQELSSGDKIIKGYLKSLAQFESHKKALRFSKSCGDVQWVDNDHSNSNDNDDDGDDSDSAFSDLRSDSHIKCVIDIQSRYQALAQPVGNSGLVIYIVGQRNLRGAFHESTVLVELIDSPSHSKRQDKKKVYNGKVVKLVSLSNHTFLCEVDHRNLHRFFPINKKDPAFYNLPMLSKNESGVVVFDSQSLKDVPRVVQVFPPQLARKRIFIVQYLHWNHDKFKNPVGIVIDSVSKGYTYTAGEKLLCAQYKFDFDAEVDSNYKPVKPVHPHKCDEMFAIIEKSGEILENAFSVQAKDKHTYIISYYVVNIARCIEDERLTDLLKKRGVSAFVKTDKLNKWKLHSMFPLALLKNLNFELNKPCSCFRISCSAEVKNGNVTYKPLETSIEEVFGILTKTYTQQQMENKIEVQFEFVLLFHIAQCLQLKRLRYSEATYNCVFDVSETPRAQLVLREFSSWANKLVAMKLAHSSLTLFPLYCKLPPDPEEKKSVYKDHGEALQTSVHNKYFLPNNGYKLLPDVIIYRKALPLLLEALKDQHTFKYLAMLSYDNFFPQLHVASQRFRSITKSKEFKLCSNTDEIDFTASHDSTSYTTMFTSPLTSFFDIVVQHMLSAALNRQPSKYGKDELDFICGKANKDFKRKSDFVEDMFNLQLGVTLKAFNHNIIGYIEKIDNKNRLTLSFPSHELKNLSEHQSSFNIAHLLAFKNSGSIQLNSKSSINLYEWNIKVASFTGPPSIFTSPTIALHKLENAGATIDITVFLASGEEEKSHFYIELDKKHLSGSVESSAVSVSQHEWKELIKIMSPDLKDVEKQCKEATRILSSCYTENLQRPSFKRMAEQTVCWSGTVRRKLQQKYDSIHAWFGAAQDTALIYPKIQQIEIAPFLKVCIQHNSEPEKCFANISLVNASRESYSDIDEYMDLWGQVVIAENAVSSVRTRDILLLENVALQWPKLEYCCDSYAGDYYRVPKNEFVIMKPPEDFNKSNIELFDLQRGDLLCVQYEVPEKKLGINMGFVFHMFVEEVSVTDITTKDNSGSESNSDEDSDCESNKDLFIPDSSKSVEHEKVYNLSLSQSVEKISEKFNNVITKDPNCTCKVQILHISPPQRRIYRCLRNLHRASDMTQYIACGDTDSISQVIKDSSKFSMEEISSVLRDEKVLHLWDKPGKKLSTNQMDILRKACRSKFLIIHGPPGTGKSTVGAHLAYAYARLNQITKKKTPGQQKNRCVVYCGASNTSVDVVAKMLCDLSDHKTKQQKYRADKLKVLRVYPNNIEQSVYPNPFELLHDSEASSVNENSNFKRLKLHSLHYKIRYECGNLGETIKTLEKHFTENKQREKFASKADRMKYRKAIADAEDKILSDDIDILICTCNEMASARIFRNIEAVQVIIDEAAMVTEPEIMIPIQHAKQVILIGDHQQLQPKVHSKHADRSGLTTSLFQRYVDVIEFEYRFLNEQFRMHKKIFEFPANWFYGVMKLFTNQNTAKEMEIKAKSLKTFWPNQDPATPFVFCDVIGTEKVTDTEFIDKVRVGQESKYNPKEADKIVEIVKVLVMNYGIKQEDILALSPYQAQCKHIQDKLKSSKLSDVKCATVKSSEGNECGIVLLSTVRSLPLEDIEDPEALTPDRGWLSENLGFLTDKHIINVGITRCQYGLVIVGNKCLLDYDDTWSNLICFCSKHGNVIPEKHFPSRSDIEKIRGFSVRR